MSNKSFLLGDVELQLDEIKKLNQYFENILTYNADRQLVPKKGEDGKELKKLKLNFSIFQEGRYGRNVSFTIPQTKEQRENKEPKKYVANGKIYFASDDLQGFVQKSDNASSQKEEVVAADDFPMF
jgi:hypothetical protein